jgi:thiamine biosynthesis protein ThiS
MPIIFMQITVNGELQQVPEGQTILGLLRTLELDPDRVAVELDRRIVKAPEWAAATLREGSRLEIVQFVGGG